MCARNLAARRVPSTHASTHTGRRLPLHQLQRHQVRLPRPGVPAAGARGSLHRRARHLPRRGGLGSGPAPALCQFQPRHPVGGGYRGEGGGQRREALGVWGDGNGRGVGHQLLVRGALGGCVCEARGGDGQGGDEQGDDHAHVCVCGRLLPRAAQGRGDGPLLETHRDGDSGDAAVHPEERVWVRRLCQPVARALAGVLALRALRACVPVLAAVLLFAPSGARLQRIRPWGAPGPLHGGAWSFLHGHLQGSVHDDLGRRGTSPRD